MFRYNVGDVVYRPLFNNDGTKNYVSFKVLAQDLKHGRRIYQVDDLLKSWFNEEELLTKEEITQFLHN